MSSNADAWYEHSFHSAKSNPGSRPTSPSGTGAQKGGPNSPKSPRAAQRPHFLAPISDGKELESMFSRLSPTKRSSDPIPTDPAAAVPVFTAPADPVPVFKAPAKTHPRKKKLPSPKSTILPEVPSPTLTILPVTEDSTLPLPADSIPSQPKEVALPLPGEPTLSLPEEPTLALPEELVPPVGISETPAFPEPFSENTTSPTSPITVVADLVAESRMVSPSPAAPDTSALSAIEDEAESLPIESPISGGEGGKVEGLSISTQELVDEFLHDVESPKSEKQFFIFPSESVQEEHSIINEQSVLQDEEEQHAEAPGVGDDQHRGDESAVVQEASVDRGEEAVVLEDSVTPEEPAVEILESNPTISEVETLESQPTQQPYWEPPQSPTPTFQASLTGDDFYLPPREEPSSSVFPAPIVAVGGEISFAPSPLITATTVPAIMHAQWSDPTASLRIETSETPVETSREEPASQPPPLLNPSATEFSISTPNLRSIQPPPSFLSEEISRITTLPSSSTTTTPSYVLKVIVLGDASVGKTALIQRFVTGSYSLLPYKPTVGADFYSQKLEYVVKATGERSTVTLQIWDTAGQERYRSLASSFYRGADVCVLVEDASRQPLSLSSTDQWFSDFMKFAAPTEPESFPFLFLLNKADLVEDAAEAKAEWEEEVSAQFGVPEEQAMVVSAKSGEGVERAFYMAARMGVKRAAAQRRPNVSSEPLQSIIDLNRQRRGDGVNTNSTCQC